MPGLLNHFLLTLRLNFKSRQALLYGYLVPFFFLIAFASIFRNAYPPLLNQLGELLTISVLGGACFGMPTALVAERQLGIWRRYRLLPIPASSLLISTMLARILIVASAALMQILLASLMYGMPAPAHPLQLALAFPLVCFAFLGLGLVIAMLANGVPAVQALGQAIFLPMIMIGGVGVPLSALPEWSRHLADFLPGIYAVRIIQSCSIPAGTGLKGELFDALALLLIGAAACIAAAKMFRWDPLEKPDPKKRPWLLLALAAWLSTGITAELTHHSPAASPTPLVADQPYTAITDDQINAVPYDNYEPDNGNVTPLPANLNNLDDDAQKRVAELRRQIPAWPPALDPNPVTRVHNLINLAALADVIINPYEKETAYLVFEKLKSDYPPKDLKKILAYLILHPTPSTTLTSIPELDLTANPDPAEVTDRIKQYATKFLYKLLNKPPPPPPKLPGFG